MSALRLGTVPDTHPYIAATLPDGVDHVRFAAGDGTGWQPSPLLDPLRRSACLAQIDVVHVHFGYEGLTAAQLADFVRDVHEAGVGLVVTVHDLRNPHGDDRSAHDRHLSILVTAADTVLTLTAGAAAEIGRRWARPVTVMAHPTLLRCPVARRQREQRQGRQSGIRTVGLHLKGLRSNVIDPLATVRAAADGAREAGARLQVDIHDGVASAVLLSGLCNSVGPGGEVRVHDRFSDDDLLRYLADLDVSVLPYRFGTHSGWLELCRDLGVAVVAPDCGYYAEQWPSTHSYINNETLGLDPASLSGAVVHALNHPRPAPADRVERLVQQAHIRATHGDIYRQLSQLRRRVPH